MRRIGRVAAIIAAACVPVGLVIGLMWVAADVHHNGDRPVRTTTTWVLPPVEVGYQPAASPGELSGFVNSPAGATAAAAAFVTTGDLVVDTTDSELEWLADEIVAASYHDAWLTDLQAGIAALHAGLPDSSEPITYRQGVLATRLLDFADGHAVVAVWHVGVLSGGGLPPQSDWATTTVELVWENGWRIAAETTEPGPTPIPNANPATPGGELEERLVGFDGFPGSAR